MAGIEEGPMNEAESQELEVVMERHKELGADNHGYGVFSSICIPRLLATIRHLQGDVAHANRSAMTRSHCSATCWLAQLAEV